MRETKVTIKIPRSLYRKIQEVVGELGFDSARDFVVYVLRDLMGDAPVSVPGSARGDAEFTKAELDAIRRKLKNLGYL
ncbi:MAG: CopG family transcriptional regulator [bacterium]|nr:CopG family transcriptional regulator [bacterium]